jgi:uncharacterized protein YbjT (DUF2867 family)
VIGAVNIDLHLVGNPLHLMIVGATGAVGREVLAAALADARIDEVVAPTRRPLPAHAKLLNPVVDFAHLPVDVDWWRVDAVVCALGTTIKAAGSQTAFAAIDRDLPIDVARLARQAGATRYAFNSSVGASLTGNFYLRTKAQAEAGIREIGYPVFTIVRPSLIDARREQSRPGERLGLVVARALKLLIPRRYRAVKPEAIARALLAGVLSAPAGENVIESEQLHD